MPCHSCLTMCNRGNCRMPSSAGQAYNWDHRDVMPRVASLTPTRARAAVPPALPRMLAAFAVFLAAVLVPVHAARAVVGSPATHAGLATTGSDATKLSMPHHYDSTPGGAQAASAAEAAAFPPGVHAAVDLEGSPPSLGSAALRTLAGAAEDSNFFIGDEVYIAESIGLNDDDITEGCPDDMMGTQLVDDGEAALPGTGRRLLMYCYKCPCHCSFCCGWKGNPYQNSCRHKGMNLECGMKG
eukprot:jgi/Ulvmu1/5716/UM024_0068.1